MCGLVGILGLVNQKSVDMFRVMFMLNSTRGIHGCGMISLYKNGEGDWYEWDTSEATSSDYVWTKDFESLTRPVIMKGLMGHSRHATRGAIKKKNNHPFVTKNILGMHNGTITGPFEGSKNYETDSEALYNLIQKYGIKKGIEKMEEESTSGAYALSFYNSQEDVVYLIRNSQRPLFIARHKRNKESIMYASDRIFLACAIAMYDQSDDWEIKPLAINTLFSYSFQKPFNERVKEEENYLVPKKIKTVDYSGWVSYSGNSSYRGYSGHWDTKKQKWVDHNKNTNQSNSNITKIKDYLNKDKNKKSKNIKIGNIVVPEKEVLINLDKGCCVCSNPTTIVNGNLNMKFLPNQTVDFLCDVCSANENADYLESQFGITNLVKPEYIKE